MLRNPVDMIHALHAQRLWNGRENIQSFEEALEAEEDRKAGRRLPPYPFSIQLLFYRDLARYHRYVSGYIETFGREQTHIIIFEEFIKETVRCYERVCCFLDVDPAFKPPFEVHNPSKRLRSAGLRRMTRSPVFNKLGRFLLPSALRQGTKSMLLRANTKLERRSPVPPELRLRLERELAPDIEALGRLLGRDLTQWWGRRFDRGAETNSEAARNELTSPNPELVHPFTESSRG